MPLYYGLKRAIRNKDERDKVIDKLIALRNRLDAHLPPKDADQNLLLATWNIRDFDKENRRGFGKRSPESFYYIAEIISRFDFITVQEINGIALLVDSAIKISPPPLDLYVGLVKPPTKANPFLVFTERLFDTRRIMDDPALDRAVVYGVAAFLHEFFQIAVTQRIGNVPPYTL